MIYKFIYLIVVLSLTSCSTILLNKKYDILFSKNNPSSNKKISVEVNDSLYEIPALVEVQRSNKNLNITVISDSITKELIIKRKLTKEFKYYNLIYYPFYLIDLTNHRRFTYGNEIKIDIDNLPQKEFVAQTYMNTKDERRNYQKNDLDLIISFPTLPIYNLKPENELRGTSIGGIGFCLGTEFYYTSKIFLNLSATGFIWSGRNSNNENETFGVKSFDFCLTNNHRINKFVIGYGLSYFGYDWYKETYATFDDLNSRNALIEKSYNSIGLAFPMRYTITDNLNLGINYKPTIFRPNLEQKYKYEHMLHIDLILNISIYKTKK